MKGLLFTYGLLIFGTIGAFRHPLIGLSVYVTFAVLRPQSMWRFAGDLSGISQIVGVATLVAWLLKGLGVWRFERSGPIVLAFSLFTIWTALSATMAANSELAWNSVTNLLKYYLPFMVGATMIRSEFWMKRMLWIIVLSQGYVAYEMNYAYLVEGYNRIHLYGYGGMDNNSIGIAMVTALGPSAVLVAASRTWRGRIAALAISGFVLHAILLTFSRGAMVGLLAVGVAAFLVLPKRPKQLAGIGLALAITLRLTGPELLARYNTAFVEQEQLDGSADSRIELWKDCLEVAVANPIFGIGPSHWRTVASSFGWPPGKSAHSVWMETMAEVGFPGVFLLFLVFVVTFLKLWPIARAPSKEPAARERAMLATGIMLSTVGFTVSGQFVSLSGLEVPYYVVMVGVGLILTASGPITSSQAGRAQAAPKGPDRPVVASTVR